MTVPILKQPSSGGLSTFRAAEYSVQVDTTPDSATPTWTWWYGISKFDPTADPTMQDDTDIGSGGFKSQQVTATSLDIAVEGLFKGVRGVDGVVPLDPGAAYVRSKRFQVGIANEVHLRYWRNDGVPDYIEHHFSCGWKDVGGGIPDLQKYTVDMKGRGKPIILSSKPVDADQDNVEDQVISSIITLGGTTATGGHFILDVDGTMITVPYNETASPFTALLVANRDAADVATGSASPWTITWNTANKPNSVTVDGTALVPSGATVSVANTLV